MIERAAASVIPRAINPANVRFARKRTTVGMFEDRQLSRAAYQL